MDFALISVAVTKDTIIDYPEVKDDDSDPIVAVQSPKENRPADTVIVDDYERSYSKYPYFISFFSRKYRSISEHCSETTCRFFVNLAISA